MKYLFALAALALSACGGSDNSTSQASTQETATPSETFALKETASADGVDLTLTSLKQTKQVADAAVVPTAGSDEIFVVAEYKLKNTSKEPIGLMDRPAIDLIDSGGQTYARDEMASTFLAAMKDTSSMANDLNPGTTMQSVVVWKVAKKDYDPASWKIVARTDPELEFKLK